MHRSLGSTPRTTSTRYGDLALGTRCSEGQGHPQLHGEFEASLGYMRPCFKITLGMFCHFPWAQHLHGVDRYHISDLFPGCVDRQGGFGESALVQLHSSACSRPYLFTVFSALTHVTRKKWSLYSIVQVLLLLGRVMCYIPARLKTTYLFSTSSSLLRVLFTWWLCL